MAHFLEQAVCFPKGLFPFISSDLSSVQLRQDERNYADEKRYRRQHWCKHLKEREKLDPHGVILVQGQDIKT
jgi:hypothetical protein